MGNNEFRDRGFVGHLSTANYLFADGHVKSLRATATGTPFNMWGQFNANSAADGPNCGTAWSINCDVTPAAVVTRLGELQAKYN